MRRFKVKDLMIAVMPQHSGYRGLAACGGCSFTPCPGHSCVDNTIVPPCPAGSAPPCPGLSCGENTQPCGGCSFTPCPGHSCVDNTIVPPCPAGSAPPCPGLSCGENTQPCGGCSFTPCPGHSCAGATVGGRSVATAFDLAELRAELREVLGQFERQAYAPAETLSRELEPTEDDLGLAGNLTLALPERPAPDATEGRG